MQFAYYISELEAKYAYVVCLTRWQVWSSHPNIVPNVVVPDRVWRSLRVIGVVLQLLHSFGIIFVDGQCTVCVVS